MDINAKKVEIIQHILIIQKPDTIRKIDQFIRDLEYKEEDGFYTKKVKDSSDDSGKEKINPINEARRKIKSILNMYDK